MIYNRIDIGDNMNNAIIIFSDNTDIKILKFLKKGFRHCLAVIEFNGTWIIYEPLCNKTKISVLNNTSEDDIVSSFSMIGAKVIKTKIQENETNNGNFLVPTTCVSSIKRILGINKFSIITPWQLYNFLIGKYNDN